MGQKIKIGNCFIFVSFLLRSVSTIISEYSKLTPSLQQVNIRGKKMCLMLSGHIVSPLPARSALNIVRIFHYVLMVSSRLRLFR